MHYPHELADAPDLLYRYLDMSRKKTQIKQVKA